MAVKSLLLQWMNCRANFDYNSSQSQSDGRSDGRGSNRDGIPAYSSGDSSNRSNVALRCSLRTLGGVDLAVLENHLIMYQRSELTLSAVGAVGG